MPAGLPDRLEPPKPYPGNARRFFRPPETPKTLPWQCQTAFQTAWNLQGLTLAMPNGFSDRLKPPKPYPGNAKRLFRPLGTSKTLPWQCQAAFRIAWNHQSLTLVLPNGFSDRPKPPKPYPGIAKWFFRPLETFKTLPWLCQMALRTAWNLQNLTPVMPSCFSDRLGIPKPYPGNAPGARSRQKHKASWLAC